MQQFVKKDQTSPVLILLITIKTNNSNVTIIYHRNPGLYLPVLCTGKTGKILKETIHIHNLLS